MCSRGSCSRDRDEHHQYDSGAAKHKAKEERAAREIEALSKVPKVLELFYSKSNAGLIVPLVAI